MEESNGKNLLLQKKIAGWRYLPYSDEGSFAISAFYTIKI
jgi:hypothetical protein